MPFFLLFALVGFENSAIRNNLPRIETMIDIISSTILGMIQAFLPAAFSILRCGHRQAYSNLLTWCRVVAGNSLCAGCQFTPA
jgi:hypothetical protein